MDTCAVCKFAGPGDGGVGTLMCRRNPPHGQMIAPGQIASYYPPIKAEGWCGEFSKVLVLTPNLPLGKPAVVGAFGR